MIWINWLRWVMLLLPKTNWKHCKEKNLIFGWKWCNIVHFGFHVCFVSLCLWFGHWSWHAWTLFPKKKKKIEAVLKRNNNDKLVSVLCVHSFIGNELSSFQDIVHETHSVHWKSLTVAGLVVFYSICAHTFKPKTWCFLFMCVLDTRVPYYIVTETSGSEDAYLCVRNNRTKHAMSFWFRSQNDPELGLVYFCFSFVHLCHRLNWIPCVFWWLC